MAHQSQGSLVPFKISVCMYHVRHQVPFLFCLFVLRRLTGYYVACCQTHEMCVLLEMSVKWVGKNKRLVEFCCALKCPIPLLQGPA